MVKRMCFSNALNSSSHGRFIFYFSHFFSLLSCFGFWVYYDLTSKRCNIATRFIFVISCRPLRYFVLFVKNMNMFAVMGVYTKMFVTCNNGLLTFMLSIKNTSCVFTLVRVLIVTTKHIVFSVFILFVQHYVMICYSLVVMKLILFNTKLICNSKSATLM